MPATIAGSHLGLDVHASRPAANAAGQPIGALYSCSTHNLIYKSDGSSWSTYATLGGGALSDQGIITYLDATVAAAPGTPASGKLRIYAKTGKVLAVKDDAGLETVLGAGGGGTTTQYPALKPGTPTDDFAAASLSGWTAHSNGGSFATGSCMTQGEDWNGSSLEMQFSAQCGTLYQTHADADLDFQIGGLRWKGDASSGYKMLGIAALNTSGNGVGVTLYDDGTAYFAAISTYSYASNSATWAFNGLGANSGGVSVGDWWLRLKRVSGTWTGYISRSGRAWDKTFATRADSIVVAQLHVGILYQTGVLYSGRLIADYWQVDV